MTDTTTGAELRSFIERYETLAKEKSEIADQQKDVLAEAKARGYDTAVLREIIKRRSMSPDDLAERDAVLEMYQAALGM
jgi:uncharacterized protein (UPF0335 family)